MVLNVSFQLREPTGLIVPKGPKFSSAREFRTDIDGTKIQFMAPSHKPRRASHDPIVPAKSYRSDDIHFQILRDENVNVPYDWRHFRLFEHSWMFNGPWFTGTRAYLEMYFDLAKPANYSNPEISLFNPRAFEQLVGDCLTFHFSGIYDELDEAKCYYMAPMNWTPYDRLPVMAVRLKVVSDLPLKKRRA